MGYHEEVKDLRLINLSSQLDNPTLVRVDINMPLYEEGNIHVDNLRMQVAANNLKILSYYTGIVLLSHQGRPFAPPSREDLERLSLKQHTRVLQKLLPLDVDIRFVPYKEAFTPEARQRISELEPGMILVWENVRFFEQEYTFNSKPEDCRYTEFFKSAGIRSCVNEAIPAWHRRHRSMMCLPYIAPTHIGMRSSHELKILEEAMDTVDSKGIIVGGIKPKWKYLSKLSKEYEIYTGGGSGQVCAATKGYDLGERNNDWITRTYSQADLKKAQKLIEDSTKQIETPRDFTVLENGERRNIHIDEISESDGIIMDIGDETVEHYAERLQNKEIRIRAGPLGVFEDGYDNGIELTRRVLGEGMIFLGGDTSQEIIQYDLLRPVMDAGGEALISGGSWLHGLSGGRYPSVDLLIEKYSQHSKSL
ncbi:MAG: phosphoglycerate kinase [Candidatus Bathyarchaeia archaeon]